jgi:hypothetical protein
LVERVKRGSSKKGEDVGVVAVGSVGEAVADGGCVVAEVSIVVDVLVV